jgi:hypothetical protein
MLFLFHLSTSRVFELQHLRQMPETLRQYSIAQAR